MALTAAQKANARRHMGLDPFDTMLNDRFTQIDADATILALTSTAITDCDTAETAIQTAYDQNSDLIEGGGARFAYKSHVTLAKQKYASRIAELGRLLAFEPMNLTLNPSGGCGGAYLTGY